MAASTAATVRSGRDGGRGCGGGWRCGDGRSGEGLGAPLGLGLECGGLEGAASVTGVAAGRVRLGFGSAAEEEEEDAGLADGCADAAVDGGLGLGLAAGCMAEDFF